MTHCRHCPAAFSMGLANFQSCGLSVYTRTRSPPRVGFCTVIAAPRLLTPLVLVIFYFRHLTCWTQSDRDCSCPNTSHLTGCRMRWSFVMGICKWLNWIGMWVGSGLMSRSMWCGWTWWMPGAWGYYPVRYRRFWTLMGCVRTCSGLLWMRAVSFGIGIEILGRCKSVRFVQWWFFYLHWACQRLGTLCLGELMAGKVILDCSFNFCINVKV